NNKSVPIQTEHAQRELWNYHQPKTSRLRNKGSRTADLAGLYYHTTTVDQAREGATRVDIGYHYVSTNCGPVDTVWVDDALPAGAQPPSGGGDACRCYDADNNGVPDYNRHTT